MRAELALTAAYLGGDVHVVTVAGPFIDSIALGVLVEASKRTKARGGVLRVVCDDRRIARIIEITGLDRVLRVHTTLREALESLEGYSLSAAGVSA